MRKIGWVGIVGAVLLAAACGMEVDFKSASAASSGGDGVPTLFEFNTLVGVPRPYTGATNAIRGVPGGGLPWVITAGKAELDANGHLEIEVDGLVLDPNDAGVPVQNRGVNPVANFRAIVSCLTKDANGAAVTQNVTTDLFPATTGPASAGGGDSVIEADIVLPSPCIAPIVFVTNPNGAWFAASGF